MEGTTASYAAAAGSSSLPWLLGAVGLVLILLFALHRGLIRSPVLTRVGPGTSGQIIQNLLFIGLLLGVLFIPLAVALEFAIAGGTRSGSAFHAKGGSPCGHPR